MNPWPIYETAKRHWRQTRTLLSEQEIRWQHPNATEEELLEGMIEFNLAFDRTLRHETYDLDDVKNRTYPPASVELVEENRRVRSELFKSLHQFRLRRLSE